jgi:hypothetical protein
LHEVGKPIQQPRSTPFDKQVLRGDVPK